MADTSKKLRIYPSINGDLDITATTIVPSAGTATLTDFRALTGAGGEIMTDAGSIPIKINDVEYYIPLLQAD